jgi:hypothetical protein
MGTQVIAMPVDVEIFMFLGVTALFSLLGALWNTRNQ